MDEAARVIAASLRAAPPRAGDTRIVAIDGRSGSGKTTLATVLQAELDAPVISLEYLYGGWDGLEHGIDLLVTEVLEPLAKHQTALIPHYDWNGENWDEPTPLVSPELLIIEGVGAGASRAARYESTVVWLESPLSVRKKRAFERDGATYRPFWDRWAAQEDAMLARERTPERADLVVRTLAAGRSRTRLRNRACPGEPNCAIEHTRGGVGARRQPHAQLRIRAREGACPNTHSGTL